MITNRNSERSQQTKYSEQVEEIKQRYEAPLSLAEWCPFWLPPILFALVVAGGALPPFLSWALSVIFGSQSPSPSAFAQFGQIGDMFGAANAFFSGAALFAALIAIRQQASTLRTQAMAVELQRLDLNVQVDEMRQQTEAHESTANHQSKAVSASIVLPLAEKVRGKEYGEAVDILAGFWRMLGRQHAGTDAWDPMLARYRSQQTRADEEELTKSALDSAAVRFRSLRSKFKVGHATVTEITEYRKYDGARRECVGIVHIVWRLYQAELIDDKIAKIVITPGVASDFVFLVWPLELVLLRERDESATSDVTIEFVRKLYDDDELRSMLY